MESLKAPSPTALAMGALVTIWTEVARRRVSVWVAVKDSMEVMERRRTLVAAQKAHEGLPEGEKAPEPEPDHSEAQSTYERMRSQSRRRPSFHPSGF